MEALPRTLTTLILLRQTLAALHQLQTLVSLSPCQSLMILNRGSSLKSLMASLIQSWMWKCQDFRSTHHKLILLPQPTIRLQFVYHSQLMLDLLSTTENVFYVFFFNSDFCFSLRYKNPRESPLFWHMEAWWRVASIVYCVGKDRLVFRCKRRDKHYQTHAYQKDILSVWNIYAVTGFERTLFHLLKYVECLKTTL